MRSKYYNTKTKTSDGLVFDSSKEARRWEQLKLLERAGEISELERQVEYELFPNQYEPYERYGKRGQRLEDGERCVHRKAVYVADFRYKDKYGNLVVEDVKGYRGGEAYAHFVLKSKAMYFFHKIKVREI